MKLRHVVPALGVVAMGMASREAAAAVALPCAPSTVEPIANAIPANLPGFASSDAMLSPTSVQLSVIGGSSASQPVTVTTVGNVAKITPTTPFVAGTSYQLEVNSQCRNGGYATPQQPFTFVATAEAPLPSTLAELVGQPTVTAANLGATKISITAGYTLSAEMRPWAAVYRLGLELDGRVIETHATITNDNVQIAATGWCDATNAATQTHSIKLRGRLPFAPLLETAAATATFDCPAPTIGNPGASPPVQPTGATETPASTHTSGGGCSMTNATTATSSLSIVGLGLGLFALVRRAARKVS